MKIFTHRLFSSTQTSAQCRSLLRIFRRNRHSSASSGVGNRRQSCSATSSLVTPAPRRCGSWG